MSSQHLPASSAVEDYAKAIYALGRGRAQAVTNNALAERLGVTPGSSSQMAKRLVVLSFGIPFALVPLVLLTRRRDVMGALVNRPVTTAIASLVAGLIISLNAFLLVQTFAG